MTQNSTEFKATLKDDQIIDIAHKIDNFIMEIGEEFHPSGIEFAAIALGRLMIFTKSTNCYDTFTQMMDEVVKLKEPEPIFKQSEE